MILYLICGVLFIVGGATLLARNEWKHPAPVTDVAGTFILLIGIFVLLSGFFV